MGGSRGWFVDVCHASMSCWHYYLVQQSRMHVHSSEYSQHPSRQFGNERHNTEFLTFFWYWGNCTPYESDIIPLQHFRHGRVELFAPAYFVETFEQILWPHARPFRSLQVVQDLAAMHHHDAIAEVHGLLHGMSDHQRGELVALDDLAREANDLVGAFRVERGGMLVEQQQLRFQPRSHQQRQRLPLTA